MKTVYICSPLKDNERFTMRENLVLAKQYCRAAVMLHTAPFAPHVFYTQFLDDYRAEERAMGFNCGMEFLTACEELWVCGTYLSWGMGEEIKAAKQNQMTIRYFKFENDLLVEREEF